MISAAKQHELRTGDGSRLVSRVVLLVVYLFLASLISVSAVTSVFAIEGLDTGYATQGK